MSVLSIATFVVLIRLVPTVPEVMRVAVTLVFINTLINVMMSMNVNSKIYVMKTLVVQILEVVTVVNASLATLGMAKGAST